MTYFPVVAGIDLETTGLLSSDHRIIEAYVGLWKRSTRIWQYDQRIDPQRSIAADAQRVHKISSADLIGKPTWEMVGPTIHSVLQRADYYVWHNGDEFDGPFLAQEFKRIGLELPDKPSIDTMQDGVWATPDGKKPRLSELAFACGVEYDPEKGHAAFYDVEVMMDCYFKGLEWGFYTAPEMAGIALAA
ncbi:3'-5' exonuclease [Agrobacterium sp. CG674]